MNSIIFPYFTFMWKNILKTCQSGCALLFWKLILVARISNFDAFVVTTHHFHFYSSLTLLLYPLPTMVYTSSTKRACIIHLKATGLSDEQIGTIFNIYTDPLSTTSITGMHKLMTIIMWSPNLVVPTNSPSVMFVLLPECLQILRHMTLLTFKGFASPMWLLRPSRKDLLNVAWRLTYIVKSLFVPREEEEAFRMGQSTQTLDCGKLKVHDLLWWIQIQYFCVRWVLLLLKEARTRIWWVICLKGDKTWWWECHGLGLHYSWGLGSNLLHQGQHGHQTLLRDP